MKSDLTSFNLLRKMRLIIILNVVLYLFFHSFIVRCYFLNYFLDNLYYLYFIKTFISFDQVVIVDNYDLFKFKWSFHFF